MIIPYIYIKYALLGFFFIFLPVLALIILKFFQKFTLGKCTSLVCLAGKTAIVTGASSGIGYETALRLASRGCRVIIADKTDTLKAKNKIIRTTNNKNIEIKHLDLASLRSVRNFAKEINETEERLDILINNANESTVGNQHTEDGLHETMQINHFGPFLLTHLLVDLLKKSAPSRIIFVSSAYAFFSNLSIENLNYPKDHPLSLFRTGLIYGNSKLCNIIAANGFAERLEDYGVTCNSLHPGWVNSNITKESGEGFTGFDGLEQIIFSPISYTYAKTPEEGAQTTLFLALSNTVNGITGKHFWDCITFLFPPGARNQKFCDDVWEESEIFVKLNEEEKIKKCTSRKQSQATCKVKEISDPNIDEIACEDVSTKEKNEDVNLDSDSIDNMENLYSNIEEDEILKEENDEKISSGSEEETEFDSNSNLIKNIQLNCEDKNSSFCRFRKSKKGEGFLTMNGNADSSLEKDRS